MRMKRLSKTAYPKACLAIVLVLGLSGCEWSSGSDDGGRKEVIGFSSSPKAGIEKQRLSVEEKTPPEDTTEPETDLVSVKTRMPTPVDEIALEHFDNDYVDHVELAEGMVSDGNRAGAMLELGKALFDDNENYEAAYMLGRLARISGKTELAESAFLAAVYIDPDMPEPWIQLGRLALKAKNLDLAEERVERALVLDPGFAGAHNIMGRIWLSRSHWHRAVHSLEKAVSLSPENRYYRNNLGFAYLLKGDYSRAIEHLEIAADDETVEAYIENNLGLAYEGAGRLQDAIAVFKEITEKSPKYVNAKINLDRLIVLAKNMEYEGQEFPMVQEGDEVEEVEDTDLIIPENEDF